MALEKITAEDFNTAIKRLTTSDKSVWWKYLDSTDDGTELCLAVGWQDGYDEDADLYQQDGYTLCTKIGYKHSNMMVNDYSDFREPYDKKGNAWQTDMAVAKGPISDSDVKWYNDEAQRIWDKYGKPDKNGTTALDLMESKKNEEKIPFKLTEFPKELKQLYDACNKRLMTCDNELSSASDVSNKHGVSSATYTFKGEYGSYVKLKVTLDYEDGEFTVSIKGLDETEGYSWDVLGSGTSDNFKSAMDAALAEFDKNIVPLVRKIQNAMKRGESLNKSESAKGSMRRKQESIQKKKESVLNSVYPVITSDDTLRYALLATTRIRKNDMVRIVPCIEYQGKLCQVYTGRVDDPVWYRAGRISDNEDLHNDKAFVAVVDTPQEALQEFRKLGNPGVTRIAMQSENRVYWDDVSDEGTIKVKNTAPFRNDYYDIEVPDNGTTINDGIDGSMGGNNWRATVYWKPKDAVTAAFKWLDNLMAQARKKGDSLVAQQSDHRSKGSAIKSRIATFQDDAD